ncbi:helix-turn-helix transcriptional regulator [Mammaliicoccus sciuri]|uniref:helix-turn-helix transcriptional regulator n=1 Tax=Mammaliicoccus sciuri TaxID=1296 RepID=UPI001FB426DA|nr:helix-turn-helix transcriptional regulator [Mammaliicoccus sciuri]MCJ0953531.1 helix-turn-helix transcriptional regulator [Mammaliicoccus sciuri]MEB8206617.1 helix-turn-helix transcriptional regulator [Mammaliicoccus sciuri]
MKNKWLIDKRNELGLTQQDLANKTGVHRSYIAMIEKGTRTPSVTVAKKIAKEINVEWVIFFNCRCDELTQMIN